MFHFTTFLLILPVFCLNLFITIEYLYDFGLPLENPLGRLRIISVSSPELCTWRRVLQSHNHRAPMRFIPGVRNRHICSSWGLMKYCGGNRNLLVVPRRASGFGRLILFYIPLSFQQTFKVSSVAFMAYCQGPLVNITKFACLIILLQGIIQISLYIRLH